MLSKDSPPPGRYVTENFAIAKFICGEEPSKARAGQRAGRIWGGHGGAPPVVMSGLGVKIS